MGRAERKADHIRHALLTGQKREHGFQDIVFVHNSLPNTRVDDINISTKINDIHLPSPLFINAMTGGGGSDTYSINKRLATVAKETNLAMAVGSQMSAIKDPSEVSTYKVVREVNPSGIIFANLGSEATVEQAILAVEMLEANALQIHLNVIQELVMPEGDRDFTRAIERIQRIVEALPVPVIVKETGFGISKEVAKSLADVGVSVIDVSGYGGTNFSRIENERREDKIHFFNEWGITTAASLAEVKYITKDVSIISSGGVQSVLDVAKSIALGASAVGMAGYLLNIMFNNGEKELYSTIQQLHHDLINIMTAIGASTISQLQQSKIVIKGETYHWLTQRGIPTNNYSM